MLGVILDVIPSYECADVDVKGKTKTLAFSIITTTKASIDKQDIA